MTVKELIKELQRYPADAKVLLEDYKRLNLNLSPISDIEEVYHDDESGEIIIVTDNGIDLV